MRRGRSQRSQRSEEEEKEEVVFIVFNSRDNVYGVFSGKEDAMRHAKKIDGYVTSMELDQHLTPFALR